MRYEIMKAELAKLPAKELKNLARKFGFKGSREKLIEQIAKQLVPSGQRHSPEDNSKS